MAAKVKRPHKKAVIVSVIIAAVIVILAAAVLLYARHWRNTPEVKQYEAELKEADDAFLSDLIGKLESEKEELSTQPPIPGETPLNTVAPAEPAVSPPGTQTNEPPPTMTAAPSPPPQDTAAPESAAPPPEVPERLLAAYNAALMQLKDRDYALVEAFIAQGVAAWSAMAAEGKTTPDDKGRLVSEYLAKAGVLEKQMDASFDELMAVIKKQLTELGVDPNPITEGYRAEYETIKQTNKDMLLDRLMAEIKK